MGTLDQELGAWTNWHTQGYCEQDSQDWDLTRFSLSGDNSQSLTLDT